MLLTLMNYLIHDVNIVDDEQTDDDVKDRQYHGDGGVGSLGK